ncbi:MAG: hypothetical protein ACRCX2_04235 [Paraclostridium sp.]
MKITDLKVYGLHESILASGFPMQTQTQFDYEIDDTDLKRARNLGQAKTGSGHDCFLKGVVVQFNLTAPEFFWRQLDRYHFIDYISSQSKMHRLLKMDLDHVCNEYVDKRVIDILKEKIDNYNNFEIRDEPCYKEYDRLYKEKLFYEIISNCPCGLELTARMTTNYLQLKTIIAQRDNHKMQEHWGYFNNYMRCNLPRYEELINK